MHDHQCAIEQLHLVAYLLQHGVTRRAANVHSRQLQQVGEFAEDGDQTANGGDDELWLRDALTRMRLGHMIDLSHSVAAN